MKNKFIFFLANLLIIFFLQSCDIKGASRPFSYAPDSPDVVWIPSKKALKRLPSEDLLKTIHYDFKDNHLLSLAEIIDITLSNNNETKNSWITARVNATEYGKSLQGEFPTIGLAGNYTNSRSAASIGANKKNIYQDQYGAGLELSYTILDFGQTRMSSEVALQSLYQADFLHNDQIQQVIQNVMENYYEYLYQKDLFTSYEQDVLDAKTSLDATEKKFKNGLSDISDIVQAKTYFFQKQLNVITQKQNLVEAYTSLINQMGLPSNREYLFQGYPQSIKTFEIEKLDELIVQSNKNRPSLFAYESQVKAKKAQVLALTRKNFPTLKGSFDIGREYYRHGYNDNYNYNATFSLNFPLFEGFFNRNNVRQSKEELAQAENALKTVKLEILKEVTDARSAVICGKDALKTAQAYLDSAEEDYKVNLKKYTVGVSTILNLIQAQASVSDARAGFSLAVKGWYTALANLSYSTGILSPPKDGYEN